MKKLAIIVFFDAFLLMLIGLVMVMSASSTYSQFKFDSLFYLFNSHFEKVIFAFIALVVFSIVPYEIYKDYNKALIFIGAIFLIITLFWGLKIKGSERWINLGITSFQPTDLAKLVLVIYLAAMIERLGDQIKNFKEGFLHLIIWVIAFSFLIMIQPNVSNAILIVFLSLILLFVGGASFKHIAISSLAFLIIGLAAAMLIPHSRHRILSFLHPAAHGGAPNMQVKQALIGLGSGGVYGVGLGHSLQSNLFLPEAYGDFIFAILGEEIGFVGTALVVFLYLVLFSAGILIAKKTKDEFGQLLAFGITFSITIYAFVNIAVATGLIPTTGLTLPFISYGGTSLLFLCASVGMLVNIAINNSPEKLEKKTNGDTGLEAARV